MHQKAEGILINSIRYTDSSYIINLYTKQSGRQAYIIKGAQSKKSKTRVNYLQALHILEFECTNKPSHNINTIYDVALNRMFSSISSNPIKNSIAFFIADILNNTLKEAEENPVMYNFLKKQILVLDSINSNIGLFSIYFLINYLKFLGIAPDVNSMTQEHYFNNEQIESFNIQYDNDFSNLLEYKIDYKFRQAFLEKLILYYQIRFDIAKFKSYEILKELFA